MDTPQKLTKAEKRELRKLEWQQEAEKAKQMEQYKKIGLWATVGIVIVLGIVGLAWLVNSPSTSQTSSITAPAPSKKDIFTKGNPKAKVVLTEYGDFQCPACKSYHENVMRPLLNEMGDEIYFVYRYFPLVNIHRNAQISAQAGYAAYKQGKFWEMYDALYENQTDWAEGTDARSVFVNYAQKIGLDTNKFLKDMESSEAKKFVDDSVADANSIGLQSTPSFFINGKKMASVNTYEEFKNQIKEAISNETTK